MALLLNLVALAKTTLQEIGSCFQFSKSRTSRNTLLRLIQWVVRRQLPRKFLINKGIMPWRLREANKIYTMQLLIIL